MPYLTSKDTEDPKSLWAVRKGYGFEMEVISAVRSVPKVFNTRKEAEDWLNGQTYGYAKNLRIIEMFSHE